MVEQHAEGGVQSQQADQAVHDDECEQGCAAGGERLRGRDRRPAHDGAYGDGGDEVGYGPLRQRAALPYP